VDLSEIEPVNRSAQHRNQCASGYARGWTVLRRPTLAWGLMRKLRPVAMRWHQWCSWKNSMS